MSLPAEPRLVYRDDVSECWHANALAAEHVSEIMGNRTAGAVVVDAPYSDKTHSGHKNGKLTADRAASFAAANAGSPSPESRYSARKSEHGESGRRDIDYAAWTLEDVATFVSNWQPRCSGWIVSITDHVLADAWSAQLEQAGLYKFAPLPLVETGSRVRMTGDGPSNWTCWIVVARPRTREFASYGTLPGAYIQSAEREINSRGGTKRIVGGKPFMSMCGIVRDYSRLGDLVVDPCCGGGVTGRAAKVMGRRFIGVDSNLAHCELTAELLSRNHQQMGMPWAEREQQTGTE